MSEQPKAIPTKYIGPTGRAAYFRSRLEARWAIFLDWFGVYWEYELTGFKFEDQTCYLPDFYIPAWRLHLEIKPGDVEIDGRDAHKMLCMSEAGKRVLLIFSPPTAGLMSEHAGKQLPNHGTLLQCALCYTFAILWFEGPKYHKYERRVRELTCVGAIEILGKSAGLSTLTKSTNKITAKCPVCKISTEWTKGKEYQRAANAAAMARFEFGEHGIDWSIHTRREKHA